MIPFDYRRAESVSSAVAVVSANPRAAFLAGGTNLVDHLKLGITEPELLVDVTWLGLDEIESTSDGGLRIGANVRNSDLAADPRVRERYPLLSQALLSGASGNFATRRRLAGTCCKEPGVATFRTSVRHATNESPALGVQHGRVTVGTTRSSGRSRPVSRSIRRTWRWRWSPWTPLS